MGRKNITPAYDDEQVKALLIKLFKDAIRDALNDGSIKVRERPILNPTVESIVLQWYYNHDSNKVYIEYRFRGQTRYGLELEHVIHRINQYIQTNFRYESLTWPEILLIDDGVHEMVDEFHLITPFTISYWKSLTGRYEFIIDEAVVNNDIVAMEMPRYDDEYYTRYQQIYEEYYTTDFNRFEEELYALKKEFNIRVDKEPNHTFTEFIERVRALNNEYAQVILTEEQKNEYIERYNTIYLEHHNDPEFNDLVEALKEEYGIKKDLNSKVPEIFYKYSILYKEFFNKDLYVLKKDLKYDDGIYNYGDVDAGDETAVGDYDFSDVDEGTDPDNVSKGIYDFNNMVNTVNLLYLELY